MQVPGPRLALLLGALVLLLGGCPGVDGPPDEPPTPPPDPSDLPCDPVLDLRAEPSSLNPLSATTLLATGGTEAYVFEQLEAPSGGILNPITGGYVPGSEAGVVDRIRLTDRGCLGEAIAEIAVVRGMVVSPDGAVLPFGAVIQYEVQEGSGSYQCSLPSVDAQGELTPAGLSSAPHAQAFEAVRVTDLQTGEEVDVLVRTAEDAAVTAEATWLFVPLGSEYRLDVSGGSNSYEVIQLSGDTASWDGEVFVPTGTGTNRFEFRDRFVDLQLEVTVVGVAPQSPPLERWGDLTEGGIILAPGDLDGDGYGDLLIGNPEIDLEAKDGGAVFLYPGRADSLGLEPTPSMSWGGWQVRESFGNAVTVADFNGDGLVDLAVGSPLADLTGTDSGGVQIFPGLVTGGFTAEPGTELLGPSSGGFYGDSLAACDFNGDGFDDLAVGTPRGEDPLAINVANNQGAVYIHLGGTEGLQAAHDDAAYGEFPDETGHFAGKANAYIGRSLAAGDVDANGLCDLAIGAWEYRTASGQGNDGAVHLYSGRAVNSFDDGGVSWNPVKIWTADPTSNSNSNFGYSLAMGNLDGDEFDDLVIGQPRFADPEASGSRHGAVWVLLGRDFSQDELSEEVGSDTADWGAVGDDASDEMGIDLSLDDLDGDGLDDLLVGIPLDEDDQTVPTPGAVDAGGAALFYGVEGSLPSTLPDAWIRSSGPGDPDDPSALQTGDRFGRLVAIHPGSESGPGSLVIHAEMDQSLGWNVGRSLVVPGDITSPWQPLDLPGGPSGQALGAGLALVGDIDGDGHDDLAVGAPGQLLSPSLEGAGTLHLFAGTPEGFVTDQSTQIREFPGHAANDAFGTTVSPAGDFDGDGYDDLVVLAPGGDRPNSFDESQFANPTACPGSRSNAGAAWIFSGGESLPSLPSFVWYGPKNNSVISRVAGPLDWNGDGWDDLVIADPTYEDDGPNNAGALFFLSGRPADASGITVLCSADQVIEGLHGGDQLGSSVTVLGDLDGDGCDEIAVGSPSEDLAGNNGGGLRILFGWGGPTCRPEGAVITMANTPAQSGDNFGSSLAGNADADGDGLPDLLVGAWNRTIGIGNQIGSVWFLPGWYLASLPPEPLTGTDPMLLWPASPDSERYRIDGWIDDERFGISLAFVPNFTEDGRAGLAIGGPTGKLGGLYDSGGVRIHHVDASGGSWAHFIDPLPDAVMGGENFHGPGADLGRWISGGLRDGEPILIVGATGADSVSPDGGTAWAIDLRLD
ncbi:MAG: hypothetical protein VX498_00375 [Myxococcota bacterium]|nr:hypothetical protein [Myxococcota bacterium]